MLTHALHRDAPKIDCLIIVGGPSGAGKTTLSQQARYHQCLFGRALPAPIISTDSRTLREKPWAGGTLIVEYATTSQLKRHNNVLMRDEIDHLIAKADRTFLVTIKLTRLELLRRYVGRLKEENLRRTPRIFRYLRWRKWRMVLSYIVTPIYRQSYAAWHKAIEIFRDRENVSILQVELELSETGEMHVKELE